MIKLSTETVFPVTDAPKHIPGRPSQASVWRWVLQGVGGIKLESILVGGKRFTSAEAIQRFCDKRTSAADGDTSTARISRQQDIQHADHECREAGI